MTDKDPDYKSVDDRDQNYYNTVFGNYMEADDDPEYTEEYAAEAVDPDLITRRDFKDNLDTGTGVGMGWLALALSLIGLFFLPIVMGVAGIIVGFIARGQGARGLGAWAIGIGTAVIILRLVAYPLM